MGFWSSLKRGLTSVVKVAAPIAIGYFTGGAGAALGGRFAGGGGRLSSLVQRGSTLYEKASPFVRGIGKLRAARAARRRPAIQVAASPRLMQPLPIGGHGFHSMLQTRWGPQSLIPMRANRIMPDPAAYTKVAAMRYWQAGGAQLSARQSASRGYRPRFRYRLRRRARRY